MRAQDKFQYSVIQHNGTPFLSIITRRLEGRRTALFEQHESSIKKIEQDYDQIFIKDYGSQGMLAANGSFQYVTHLIRGEFVFLLDDDDFITDRHFIGVLKEHAQGHDVIFFKNKIVPRDGVAHIFPLASSWQTRTPIYSHIGGSCFVVRKWVYDKYIHHFAYPKGGDWYFITEVLKDEQVRATWVDRIMMETGKVSLGTW